ncbi:nucleoside ABC transporter membrane protein [Tepidamorphus gemmatus]|uniref:Nucleoside ABC transporter membrane protein n=1 Tax=Tepidamorphus gemmatus TaxID=747076 RepID=A0A4R3MKX7_9HYPH|nr:ABC transporter permease [Tepidamorphus gemmatus]TCT12510.1 nucleoside ABC transporter membrane protein [Tepidamorphus gemmatus]
MTILEAVLLTVITASTPLLLAAIGELVAERSGVLNLGVEGMMIMGAVCAFTAAVITGNGLVGVVAGATAGLVMAFVFAVLAVSLATNQVATGLALTLFGIGVSGMIGENYVGVARNPLPQLHVPVLSDLPLVGQVVFGQDGLVYLSFALVVGVTWFLNRTRAGLTLRAVGDNHHSAHSLGLPVVRVRYLAVLFGGLCAGMAGAYLSLSYTPMWMKEMTAGRGWIALALVVFASWMPGRALIGAYLFGAITILQFHAQGAGLGIPSQFMTALPYVATIVVLVIISRERTRARANTPLCLGTPFVPER